MQWGGRDLWARPGAWRSLADGTVRYAHSPAQGHALQRCASLAQLHPSRAMGAAVDTGGSPKMPSRLVGSSSSFRSVSMPSVTLLQRMTTRGKGVQWFMPGRQQALRRRPTQCSPAGVPANPGNHHLPSITEYSHAVAARICTSALSKPTLHATSTLPFLTSAHRPQLHHARWQSPKHRSIAPQRTQRKCGVHHVEVRRAAQQHTEAGGARVGVVVSTHGQHAFVRRGTVVSVAAWR